MFDCVRLAKFGGEFNQVRLPNPIEVNRTIGVRLDSITNRSIGYAGSIPRTIPGGHGSEDLKKGERKTTKTRLGTSKTDKDNCLPSCTLFFSFHYWLSSLTGILWWKTAGQRNQLTDQTLPLWCRGWITWLNLTWLPWSVQTWLYYGLFVFYLTLPQPHQ